MQQARVAGQHLHESAGGVWTLAGRWPALGALLMGVTILYFVGCSKFPQAHNAAHDTRHASGVPCH
jgi:cobalt transporter subunit CbtB